MSARKIEPQKGPQWQFLATPADIAIYGGAAGGGKTFGLLLETLRHYNNALFSTVIFRRTTKQVTNPGGLWDQGMRIFLGIKAEPKIGTLSFHFPSGMRVQFAHLEYDKNVYDWQGSEIPLLGFDELTHFTEFQFFYMLSRNRSQSGVPGYVRATTNPDSRSWVKDFIQWWIDPETGYAIPERAGKIRWFIRLNDETHWADSKQELLDRFPDEMPKSVTFIPAKLSDNKILMENDPSYRANLMALSRVERARLLDGNWNVEPSAGNFFRKEWFEIVDVLPAQMARQVRYWDRAATEAKKGKNPDWTAGLKLCRHSNGLFYVTDMVRGQWSPLNVESAVRNTARLDGVATKVGIEQDPGQAGVSEALNYTRLLAGFDVSLVRASQDKQTRAKPVSAQCEAGNVKILRGPWNKALLDELENFPDGEKDDQVDALSGAFNLMMASNTGDFSESMAQDTIETHAESLTGEISW